MKKIAFLALAFVGALYSVASAQSLTPNLNVGAIVFSADATGTTDVSASLNAQMAKACATVKKELYIPGGTYKIASGLTANCNGLSIRGAGPKVTTIIADSTFTSGTMITFGQSGTTSGPYNLTDISVTGVNGATGLTNVLLQDTNGARINNAQIYYGGTGVSIEGSGVGYSYANRISQSTISSAAVDNISIGATGSGTTRPGEIFLSSLAVTADTGNGISIYSCGGCYLTDVSTTRGVNGIAVIPGAGQQVFNLVASNPKADTSSGSGISFAGTGTITNVQFTNWWAASSTTAEGLLINNASFDGSFVGGQVTNNRTYGVSLQAARRVTFSSNDVCNNSQAGSGSYSGIYVAAVSNWTITGGTSGQCGTVYENVGQTNRQKYGIEIAAGADYFRIVGVQLQNNVTGRISDGSGAAHKFVDDGGNYLSFLGGYGLFVNTNYLPSTTSQEKQVITGQSADYTTATSGHAPFKWTTGTGIATDNQIGCGILDATYAWCQANIPGTSDLPLVLNPHGGAVGIGTGGTTPKSRLTVGASIALPSPSTKTANYTIAESDYAIIFNCSGSCTLTLPGANNWPGRILRIRTIAAQTVVSASSNVVPLSGGAAGTAILAATAGKWADLQSDGTNWQIMAGN